MGTNAGGFILSGGHDFLISELEWARIIGELGPLMGLIVIFLRLLLGIKITLGCYKKLTENDFLSWMLLSLGLFSITQSGWGQPTSLGFCVVIVGLTLAAMKPLNSLNKYFSFTA